MTAQEIAQADISVFNRKITNEIFLTIQNNRELMQQYLRAVQNYGLDVVNQTIGKEVKRSYALTNS